MPIGAPDRSTSFGRDPRCAFKPLGQVATALRSQHGRELSAKRARVRDHRRRQGSSRPAGYPAFYDACGGWAAPGYSTACACRYGRSWVPAGTYSGWRGWPPAVSPRHIGRLKRLATTAPRSSNDSCDPHSELAELRAENAQLWMERDLLKRSMAFWVKELAP